eukprot:XP_011672438.1 PREDICTED: uncharacterized protein LOC100888904 [Strongylocentrotus purpuratus]
MANVNKSNILKRTNFRQEERDVLVSLITEYRGVLDRRNSKDTRWRYSNLTPTEAWQLITDKYNSHPGFRHRDPAQLRKCWMNMKARSQFSMAQRRQLGLECSSVRPPSRSFSKARQTVAIRLRNTGTPNTLNSRSFASRKSNLSRVNTSTQLKIKKSRQRMQQHEGYNRDVVQQREYGVAKSAQDFSNYHLQSGVGNTEHQYLRVQGRRDPPINRQTQPRPVQLHRSADVVPQSSEVQRLPELRTSQGYLMHDARSADQHSGNIQRDISPSHIQGQQQMLTVVQNLAQSSNRSQPIAMQPGTILSQMEQFSPPMPQRLTVGEFLGKTVEMRSDATRTQYNTHDDAPGLGVSLQHLHAEDNPGIASVTVAERLLPQESTANASPITYQTVTQVRSIESLDDLENVLESVGPVISNVKSISDESRPKESEATNDSDIEEIQLIIKTEDEVHEINSSVETVTRTERTKPQNKTRNITKEATKVIINVATQTETVAESNGDVSLQSSTKKQGESLETDENRSKKQNRDKVVLANPRSTLCDQNEDKKLEKDLHYVDDDEVMEEDNDVSFIPVETEKNDAKELNDDVDDQHDETGDPSHSFELGEHPNEDGDWYDLADEERKAGMDLLFYEVEKVKEEAGAAKCRRELLEVELQTARQQMELTRIKQEVEIELMREKVRQERAKADSMMVQKKETELQDEK